MPDIQVLDQATINQIAAGEVVDRPSSVVKELTENAMDAGASAVTIEIREGGISMIRITDNGCGIPGDQVRTAFLPHATSKIRSAEDLLAVSSLGFRGEALASIAAVAQVELITKTHDSLTGSRYRIEGGEELSLEEIGAPEGTTFIVRNLFFNTPARRNFLKSAATEGSYISTLVERLALSHPGVSFRLIVNNQTKLHTSGNHKLKDMIYTIYGREIASGLLPIHHESESMEISGFIGKPEINRGNRTYENYFVNGRYVKSAIVTKAVENAYRGFVMQQKYPFAVFHLQIDSSQIDVNVHPNKMELRFRDEEAVYQAVYRCIRQALTGEELIPRQAFQDKDPGEKRPPEGRGPEPFERSRLDFTESSRRPDVVREPSTFEQIRRNQRNAALGNQQFHAGTRAETSGAAAASAMMEVLMEPEPETAASSEGQGKTLLPPEEEMRKAESHLKEEPLPKEESHTEDVLHQKEAFPRKEESQQQEEPNRKDESQQQEEPHRKDESQQKAELHQMELFEERLLTPETRAEYRIIGQLFDTYWLFQYKDKLLIMDQHAAHEKVLYEKNVRQFRTKDFTAQQILPPRILTLNAREIQALEEYRKDFEDLGFQIEPFGGREYAVYAIPGNLLGLEPGEVLVSMIDALADENGHTETSVIHDKLALMSCKAAVKGNNRLSLEEVNALLDELLTLDNPYMCPHGRPTIITMTEYELEKKFKRVVS